MFGGWPISKGGNGVSVPTRSWPSWIRPRSAPPPPPPSPSSSSSPPHPAPTPIAAIAMTAATAVSRNLISRILSLVSFLGGWVADLIRASLRRDCPCRLLHFLKYSWEQDGHRAAPQSPVRRPLRERTRGDRQHAAGRAAAPDADAGGPPLGEARGPQPDGLRQGPRRQVHDRGRRGPRRHPARAYDPRADVRQHRH